MEQLLAELQQRPQQVHVEPRRDDAQRQRQLSGGVLGRAQLDKHRERAAGERRRPLLPHEGRDHRVARVLPEVDRAAAERAQEERKRLAGRFPVRVAAEFGRRT